MKSRSLKRFRFTLCAVFAASLCSFAHGEALGLHAGRDSDISQYEEFGNWLGKPVMYRVTFAADDSWDTIASPYFLNATRQWLASNPSRVEVVSVPLVPKHSGPDTLDAVAAGQYDKYFTKLAQNLASKTGAPSRIIVRLGWEPNGTWYAWSAVKSPESYAKAFRHVVQTMRAVNKELRFEWNLSRTGEKDFDWTSAYPGDDVVDIVSMDVYDQYNHSWDEILNGKGGLRDFRKFARAHDKPEAYAEWSVSNSSAGHGDNQAFIKNMHDWFESGNVLYAAYWNTSAGGPDAAIEGRAAGKAPKAAKAFKSLFSR
jgi:hypothetical protein